MLDMPPSEVLAWFRYYRVKNAPDWVEPHTLQELMDEGLL